MCRCVAVPKTAEQLTCLSCFTSVCLLVETCLPIKDLLLRFMLVTYNCLYEIQEDSDHKETSPTIKYSF
jgi:hypothetical protein